MPISNAHVHQSRTYRNPKQLQAHVQIAAPCSASKTAYAAVAAFQDRYTPQLRARTTTGIRIQAQARRGPPIYPTYLQVAKGDSRSLPSAFLGAQHALWSGDGLVSSLAEQCPSGYPPPVYHSSRDQDVPVGPLWKALHLRKEAPVMRIPGGRRLTPLIFSIQ